MDEVSTIEGNHPECAKGCWLVLAYPGNPSIRFDACRLDRILAQEDDLFLTIDKVRIVLRISGGAEMARKIAEDLAPYTTSAPITTSEAHDHAKLRLEIIHGNHKGLLPPAFFFGEVAVHPIGDELHVGKFCFEIPFVERYALLGAEIPHPDGRFHAALASLAIADARRRVDPEVLATRIAEYESRKIPDIQPMRPDRG